MQKERNAFKAGIFIIISVVLIGVITLMIKGIGRFTEPTDIRSVEFALSDNIGGLRIGDDVRVGGLKVGIVKGIELIPQSNGTPKIHINFTIPSRIPLHGNARVAVERGLTGTSNLNIDNLGDGEMLARGQTLSGSPDSLSTILAGAKEIMPAVKETIFDVKTKSIPKANAMLDTGKEALAQIRDLFGDTKTDIRETVKNLNSATATIDKKLPPIMDNLHEILANARKTVDSVNVALEDVKKTVANTRDITASGRAIVSGNKSKIDAMIASLKISGDNLKAATAEVRHSPWRLLYKPTPGEVANLNLYDSARQFSEGASNLNDAASALRDALKDPNADPARVQELVNQLDKSFATFNEVEDQLWKGVKP